MTRPGATMATTQNTTHDKVVRVAKNAGHNVTVDGDTVNIHVDDRTHDPSDIGNLTDTLEFFGYTLETVTANHNSLKVVARR